MTFSVPLSDVRLTTAQKAAALDVLESGWLSMGPTTAAFEHDFAVAAGAPDAVCLSSATAALILALQLADVGAGDEVIVPSLTFVADANAVRTLGAIPVFADIVDPQHPSVDLDDVLSAVSDRTKAVIVVHYGGYVTELGTLASLRERGITVIEDASHAVGPLSDGGPWLARGADVTIFSFFANKNLAVGEGGMLLAVDGDLSSRARRLRSHGMTTGTWDRHSGHASDYDVVEVGWNFRPQEVSAALGRAGLPDLDSRNRDRRSALHRYQAGFEGSAVSMIHDAATPTTGHIAVAVLPNATRPSVRAALTAAGIQSSFHYPPIHQFTAYRDLPQRPLPATDAAAERLVTLPLHPWLADDVVDHIVAVVLDQLD